MAARTTYTRALAAPPTDHMPPTDTPPTLDPTALARWQAHAPAASPWLHEEIGRRMQERLAWMARAPQTWCDWEPVRGGMQTHDLIVQRYPKSSCWIVQQQPEQQRVAAQRWRTPRWARWAGRAAAHLQEPAPQSLDMLWANMALHQQAQPPAVLRRWAQWLKPDGMVLFSCLGPDTLRQLRSLYQQLGWPPPAQQFTDMHDLGDMLVANGFAEPVMDMECIELQYTSTERLRQELRELGRNLHPQRFAALRGRQWLAQWHQALQSLADAQGRIGLTFEIVYGHAIKAAPAMPVAAQTHISLADMRQTLQKHRRET